MWKHLRRCLYELPMTDLGSCGDFQKMARATTKARESYRTVGVKTVWQRFDGGGRGGEHGRGMRNT
jgi:hypothetical protein